MKYIGHKEKFKTIQAIMDIQPAHSKENYYTYPVVISTKKVSQKFENSKIPLNLGNCQQSTVAVSTIKSGDQCPYLFEYSGRNDRRT